MKQPRNILLYNKDKHLFLEVYQEIDGLYKGIECLNGLDSLDTKEKPFSELFKIATERMELGGRDRGLEEKLSQFSGFFINSGFHQSIAQNAVQNTDERHTIASFDYLVDICHEKGFSSQEEKKVLSAMICHDCAYPVTKDFSDFTDPTNRNKHMQDGAAAFRCFALEINKKFSDFYSMEEIKDIATIIGQHDNPGIGNPFETDDPQLRLLLAHREADRLWMVDKGGFALDLLRRIVEKGQYNPTDYLANVVCKHMKESWVYPYDPGFKTYSGEKTFYTTDKGFDIFQNSVNEIKQDYGINEGEFLERLQERIKEAKINPGKREE